MKKLVMAIGLVAVGMLMTADVARADHRSRGGCGFGGPTIVRHGNHFDIYGAGHHGGFGGYPTYHSGYYNTYHSGFYNTNPFGGGFYGRPSYNSGCGQSNGFGINRGGVGIYFGF